MKIADLPEEILIKLMQHEFPEMSGEQCTKLTRLVKNHRDEINESPESLMGMVLRWDPELSAEINAIADTDTNKEAPPALEGE